MFLDKLAKGRREAHQTPTKHNCTHSCSHKKPQLSPITTSSSPLKVDGLQAPLAKLDRARVLSFLRRNRKDFHTTLIPAETTVGGGELPIDDPAKAANLYSISHQAKYTTAAAAKY